MAISRYRNGRGSAGLGRALQVERSRVDAEALAGRPWSVVEDVAQMRATVAAANLGADHAVALVRQQLDALRGCRRGEARPARARHALGIRDGDLVAARHAHDP